MSVREERQPAPKSIATPLTLMPAEIVALMQFAAVVEKTAGPSPVVLCSWQKQKIPRAPIVPTTVPNVVLIFLSTLVPGSVVPDVLASKRANFVVKNVQQVVGLVRLVHTILQKNAEAGVLPKHPGELRRILFAKHVATLVWQHVGRAPNNRALRARKHWALNVNKVLMRKELHTVPGLARNLTLPIPKERVAVYCAQFVTALLPIPKSVTACSIRLFAPS